MMNAAFVNALANLIELLGKNTFAIILIYVILAMISAKFLVTAIGDLINKYKWTAKLDQTMNNCVQCIAQCNEVLRHFAKGKK